MQADVASTLNFIENAAVGNPVRNLLLSLREGQRCSSPCVLNLLGK